MLKTTGAVIRALSKVADDVPGRYALNGLHVQGNLVEATDGHVAVCVSVAGEPEDRQSHIYECPELPRKIGTVFLHAGERLVLRNTDGIEWRMSALRGSFPELAGSTISDGHDATLSIRINARVLRKALNAFIAAREEHVTVTVTAAEEPVRLETEHVTACVMPMICQRPTAKKG